MFLKNQHEMVLNYCWDKDVFLKDVKQYHTGVSPCSSYLASEFELLRNFQNKSIHNSVFYEYAKIMDVNLNKEKYITSDYSVLPIEMMARSFEGYVGLKLEKMNLPNKIADASEKNFFVQRIAEVKTYEHEWDKVMSDVRDMLNTIAPIKIKEEVLEKDRVLNNISKMKERYLNTTMNAGNKLRG